MKISFSRALGNWRKRLVATALVALAVAVPAATLAAQTVAISADTTVANATKSGSWASSTTAGYNEVVDVQVVYNNEEDASSTKTANNLHVKINIPTTAGANQTITTKTSADNSNTVNGSSTVTLSRADAYLQYIPGTATWKHATSANGPMTTTQKVSDDVVLAANGANLGNENPCQAGSIQVQARVMVPGLTVDKFVRAQGDTKWSTSINAKDGDTIQYEIAYHNTGNTVQNDVEFRDQLPKGITYVPGSTMLKSTNYPNGTSVTSNALVASNGITVGDYAPGAAGYVMFTAKVDASALACGSNTVRNLAFVQPYGMNYYYNTADVVVNKTCENTPAYACTAFDVTKNDANMSVQVSKYAHTETNGATFKNVVIDWGDGSDALTTNTAVGQSHTFSATGQYTITATTHFTVNGKDVTAGGCATTVAFGSTPTPPVTPGTPEELPHTGASQTIGLFGATVVAAAVAHRLFARRRQSR